MEKLIELVGLCKASVQISVNNHRDVYYTVLEYISKEERRLIDKDVLAEMVKLNTIVEVQVYPRTPIGSYVIYHYDINIAVDKMLQTVKDDLEKYPVV